jgi:hypothetical protein
MAFDSIFQPILQDTGKLAISCCKAEVDSIAMGIFKEASFNVDGELKERKGGYPQRLLSSVLDKVTATASVTFQEPGGQLKTILTGIINSLNTGVVPTHDVLLEVYRPVAENITIGMTGAALLQEFTLNFANDFNEVALNFEQLFTVNQVLTDVIAFSTLGQVTTSAQSPIVSADNISIGLPLIKVGGVSLGAIQSASLKLSTVYKRVETGLPRKLTRIVPLEHTVTLEVASEEFFTGSLYESLALGASAVVSFSAALYDGTAIVLTMPEAYLVPAGGPNISQTDFATINKKFIATGSTLLTIA